jgi:hypothetical protein
MATAGTFIAMSVDARLAVGLLVARALLGDGGGAAGARGQALVELAHRVGLGQHAEIGRLHARADDHGDGIGLERRARAQPVERRGAADLGDRVEQAFAQLEGDRLVLAGDRHLGDLDVADLGVHAHDHAALADVEQQQQLGVGVGLDQAARVHVHVQDGEHAEAAVHVEGCARRAHRPDAARVHVAAAAATTAATGREDDHTRCYSLTAKSHAG